MGNPPRQVHPAYFVPLQSCTLPTTRRLKYKAMDMSDYRAYQRWLLAWKYYMALYFAGWDSAAGGSC